MAYNYPGIKFCRKVELIMIKLMKGDFKYLIKMIKRKNKGNQCIDKWCETSEIKSDDRHLLEAVGESWNATDKFPGSNCTCKTFAAWGLWNCWIAHYLYFHFRCIPFARLYYCFDSKEKCWWIGFFVRFYSKYYYGICDIWDTVFVITVCRWFLSRTKTFCYYESVIFECYYRLFFFGS